jgi:hypothetical protein
MRYLNYTRSYRPINGVVLTVLGSRMHSRMVCGTPLILQALMYRGCLRMLVRRDVMDRATHHPKAQMPGLNILNRYHIRRINSRLLSHLEVDRFVLFG